MLFGDGSACGATVENSKKYGSSVAVDGVIVAIGDGEFVTQPGLSVCGKTTTLRMVAGLSNREPVKFDSTVRSSTTSLPANEISSWLLKARHSFLIQLSSTTLV